MKFVLHRGSQQRVGHKGSGMSSKAAVHLCLLDRWMHSEGGLCSKQAR